jgi:hypothetical protein
MTTIVMYGKYIIFYIVALVLKAAQFEGNEERLRCADRRGATDAVGWQEGGEEHRRT